MDLSIYVPPRPRLYADRKWLEGYTEAAEEIRDMANPFGPDSYLGPQRFRRAIPSIVSRWKWDFALGLKRNSFEAYQPPVTASDAGYIDAYLDSVDC